MKSIIIKTLKEMQVSDYTVCETVSRSAELFFIKQTLDSKRITDLHDYSVMVYRDFEKDGKKFRGMSNVSLFPGMTDTEIKEKLEDAYLAASFICNPTYKLPAGKSEPEKLQDTDLALKTPEENAAVMAAALFEADCSKEVFINSAEIFAIEKECFIEDSKGTNVSYKAWEINGEFVAQCKEPKDVETYQRFKYTTLDREAIKAKARRTLEYTKARAFAETAPKAGKYRVILSGSYVKELFGYYVEKASAAYIFGKFSNYKLGDKVAPDCVSLKLKASHPYSEEGTPMYDRDMISDGELKLFHGGIRLSQAIGAEPTGFYEDFEMKTGSVSLEEMKKKPYLHVVNFSDFQTDAFTGHFGGEIRLAFLFDGEKEIPVTGGSINGIFKDAVAKLVLSSDKQNDYGFEGPFAVCLDNVTVAGC